MFDNDHFCGCDICGDKVFGRIERLEKENEGTSQRLEEANRRLETLSEECIYDGDNDIWFFDFQWQMDLMEPVKPDWKKVES